MTAAGWIFMLCSTGLVTGVMVFCFCRVLTRPPASEHMHAPLDIDTQDQDT
jgi:hypothetical protein